ncbi:DUF3667 domain-containing protein [Bizionia sp. KMM 8389]
MNTNKHTCKNCETRYNDSFAYCPHCGQKRNDVLTLKVLFYNTISNYFSFDARFFKSFMPLMFKPGFLAHKYIEGKRLLYLHPGQMYIFVSVIFFFLFSFIEQDQAQRFDANLSEALRKDRAIDSLITTKNPDAFKTPIALNEVLNDTLRDDVFQTIQNTEEFSDLSKEALDSVLHNPNFRLRRNMDINFTDFKKLDSLIAADTPNAIIYKEMGLKDTDGYFTERAYTQGLKFYKSKQASGIIDSFYGMIPFAMFFLLPIFAFILKLLHLKQGNYVNHLVFSFYFFSYLFTTFSVIIVINFIFDIPNWIDWLIVLSTAIYLILALKSFYEQNWFKSIVKWAITIFVFLSFVTPVTMVFLLMYALLYF